MDCKSLTDGLQILTRLEAYGPSRCNRDLLPRARITTDACLARTHGEHAEATQFNTVALDKRMAHAVEDRVDGGFGLIARQAGPLDDTLNQILFDQAESP
jgi:hypothetical protein